MGVMPTKEMITKIADNDMKIYNLGIENDKLKDNVIEYIHKVNFAYYNAFSEMRVKYSNAWQTVYYFPVCSNVKSDFIIETFCDDYFEVRLNNDIGEGETKCTIIKVPFNESDIKQFVDKFKNDLETSAVRKRDQDVDNSKIVRKKMYEELKKEFG